MSRRFASLLAVLLVLAVAAPATAAPEPDPATAAAVKAELEAATRDFVTARDGLEEAERNLARAERDARSFGARLEQARRVLGEQAASMYKGGGLGGVASLLGDDTASIAGRMEFLDVLGARRGDAIAEARLATAGYERAVATMTATRDHQAALTTQRKSATDRLAARFAVAERLADEAAAKARAEARAKAGAAGEAAAPAADSGGGPGPVSGGIACPVGQPRSFIDSWGAGRSGGRSHKGVDMMAPHGTPQFAYTSGTVTRTRSGGGLGGITLYLRGANGDEYYYAHLSKLLVTAGQKVKAGERVGLTGSTGNASASAPHLHFEVHAGGGAAVNPYPYVKRACG
jgi:murein DD-endopeptidase MepM/ murein hydrolase activator NlpD